MGHRAHVHLESAPGSAPGTAQNTGGLSNAAHKLWVRAQELGPSSTEGHRRAPAPRELLDVGSRHRAQSTAPRAHGGRCLRGTHAHAQDTQEWEEESGGGNSTVPCGCLCQNTPSALNSLSCCPGPNNSQRGNERDTEPSTWTGQGDASGPTSFLHCTRGPAGSRHQAAVGQTHACSCMSALHCGSDGLLSSSTTWTRGSRTTEPWSPQRRFAAKGSGPGLEPSWARVTPRPGACPPLPPPRWGTVATGTPPAPALAVDTRRAASGPGIPGAATKVQRQTRTRPPSPVDCVRFTFQFHAVPWPRFLCGIFPSEHLTMN